MFVKILIALAVLAALFAAVVSARPSRFRVTRTIAISAPSSAAFAHVNDLHQWQAWSPWAKLDPAAVNSFEGAPAGEGAVMRWSGNNKVGTGSMTITESRPNERVRFKLEFLKPFQAVNTAEFTFLPEGNQTVVAWTMFGENNFMGKVMSLFMNCDKRIGGQFEKGLAQLKAVVEGTSPREEGPGGIR